MLAIIGGTGLYDLAGLQIESQTSDDTPFGKTSGAVVRGRVGNTPLLFLARHGAGHRLLPHEVNYRANVYALKRAGATPLPQPTRRPTRCRDAPVTPTTSQK